MLYVPNRKTTERIKYWRRQKRLIICNVTTPYSILSSRHAIRSPVNLPSSLPYLSPVKSLAGPCSRGSSLNSYNINPSGDGKSDTALSRPQTTSTLLPLNKGDRPKVFRHHNLNHHRLARSVWRVLCINAHNAVTLYTVLATL